MKKTYTLFLVVVLPVAVGLTPRVSATAESHPFSIAVPSFLIPLGGEVSTLDIYTDGRPAEVTGFNVLRNQKVFIPANSVSSGSLTVNLHFSGLEPQIPGTIVDNLQLDFSNYDLDLLPDQVLPGVTLVETASLSAINGVPLQHPFSFEDYLRRGTRITDDRLVTLDPIMVSPSASPGVNFAEPFVLTFSFTATATSRGLRAHYLYNAPETLDSSNFRLTVFSTAPDPIPEPSTLTLLGLGALGLGVAFWRRRRK